MRLGFWNRLAIVATVVVSVVAPTSFVISSAADLTDRREAYYETCMSIANQALKSGDYQSYSGQQSACWKERFPRPDTERPGWVEWRIAAMISLASCAFFYLLIWAITATAKWVWRGRKI